MTVDLNPVTLLWALRSPCNLGCRYCYFGTIEEHRAAIPQQSGALSHLARTDLDLAAITAFVHTLPASRAGSRRQPGALGNAVGSPLPTAADSSIGRPLGRSGR